MLVYFGMTAFYATLAIYATIRGALLEAILEWVLVGFFVFLVAMYPVAKFLAQRGRT